MSAPLTPEEEAQRRLDGICDSLGIRFEDITCEPNEGAPDGYQWGAWLGEFELHSKVGTGRTPDEAIEDLLDMLGEDQ